jgi:hypothetical protein
MLVTMTAWFFSAYLTTALFLPGDAALFKDHLNKP